MKIIIIFFLLFNLVNANSIQQQMDDYLNAYLKAFEEKGMKKEYLMLKKHSMVDKRLYPTPDPKTWITLKQLNNNK